MARTRHVKRLSVEEGQDLLERAARFLRGLAALEPDGRITYVNGVMARHLKIPEGNAGCVEAQLLSLGWLIRVERGKRVTQRRYDINPDAKLCYKTFKRTQTPKTEAYCAIWSLLSKATEVGQQCRAPGYSFIGHNKPYVRALPSRVIGRIQKMVEDGVLEKTKTQGVYTLLKKYPERLIDEEPEAKPAEQTRQQLLLPEIVAEELKAIRAELAEVRGVLEGIRNDLDRKSVV